MKRLEGKVAIVSGSTSGIGKATAILFAKEGAKVVVSGRREEIGNSIVENIKADAGEAIFVKTDITNEEDVKELVAKTIETFGKIDILVNCVGGAKTGLLHTLTSDDWEFTLNVDAKGTFYATKYVLPYMMEQKKGSIVNVSSTSINVAQPGTSLYQFCKCGINAMTRIVATEYASYGIRCNVVAPGYTDTEILAHMPAEMKEKLTQSLPFKRMADPMEIAYPILFMASDESSYCSGRILDANGAWAL